MSAREEILAGVRRALAGASAEGPVVPRGYRERALGAVKVRAPAPEVAAAQDGAVPDGAAARGGAAAQGADGAVVSLFVERVEDYRAVVVRCAEDEVAARVAEALRGAGSVVVPHGLPEPVLAAVKAAPGVDVVPDHGQGPAELDAVAAVLTTAAVGIAETGTIVLDHGPGQGRRALSLVPDLHVCVVRADQVVRSVPAAVAALDPTRPQTWISGPSATSDIELDRVEGVHGPRRLHVIVVG